MQILGIIPARYASSRFPGKPLADIGGKSMIQRVYEQAQKSRLLSDVVVATDDERIVENVSAFGGKARMTASSHQSGTDRCAEIMLHYDQMEAAINIQGDEPFINPAQIDLIATSLTDRNVQIATLVKKITTEGELWNTNTPKVVFSTQAEALYFSRQALPFLRDVPKGEWLQKHNFFKHIGIYGYRRQILERIAQLPVSQLENAEGLEQLRWLENGFKIQVSVTSIECHAVDHPDDLLKLKQFYQR